MKGREGERDGCGGRGREKERGGRELLFSQCCMSSMRLECIMSTCVFFKQR